MNNELLTGKRVKIDIGKEIEKSELNDSEYTAYKSLCEVMRGVSEATSYLSEKIYKSHFKKLTAHLKILEKQQQQKGITPTSSSLQEVIKLILYFKNAV